MILYDYGENSLEIERAILESTSLFRSPQEAQESFTIDGKIDPKFKSWEAFEIEITVRPLKK